MRFPSFPTFLRTFYTFSNATLRAVPTPFNAVARPIALRASMPTIPFLGALFGQRRDMSEYQGKMVYQAQLTPDQLRVIRSADTEAPYAGSYDKHMPDEGTYVRRPFRDSVPLCKNPLLTNFLNRTALDVGQPSTKPIINSNQAVAGLRTSTRSQAP